MTRGKKKLYKLKHEDKLQVVDLQRVLDYIIYTIGTRRLVFGYR